MAGGNNISGVFAKDGAPRDSRLDASAIFHRIKEKSLGPSETNASANDTHPSQECSSALTGWLVLLFQLHDRRQFGRDGPIYHQHLPLKGMNPDGKRRARSERWV
jgi:hypothetical protein